MSQPTNCNNQSRSKGFTLIEMIIAVGIFSIMMTIAVGALLSLINTNARTQTLKSVVNNVNVAVESMAKSMRVGTVYHCGINGAVTVAQDCPAGDNYLAFESASGDPNTGADQIVYRYNATNKSIERSTDGGGSFVAITAPEVTIDRLTFYAVGTALSDGLQPKVVITVSGHSGDRVKDRSDFNLQTTVTQRLFDS